MARHLPLTFARVREGLTNRELSLITAIREDRLSRIQHGHAVPTAAEADRLAAALDIDPALILPASAVEAVRA